MFLLTALILKLLLNKNKTIKWNFQKTERVQKTPCIITFVVGFSLRSANLSENSILLLSYPGELFMRILKLIILPLIISSLVMGSASLNARLNGRIALRTLVYFFCTSVINAVLGVALALIVHPGDAGLKTSSKEEAEPAKAGSVLDSLLDLGR